MSGQDKDELEECFKAYGIGRVDAHVLAEALVFAGFQKQPAKAKGNTPLGKIRELFKHLDHWERQEHTTVGIDYLRRHFKDAA